MAGITRAAGSCAGRGRGSGRALDFHYDFNVQGPNFVWAGAGLGLRWFDPAGEDDSDTDLVLNLLAGIGFRAGGVVPYFQAKLIVDGGSEFVLAFGVRF